MTDDTEEYGRILRPHLYRSFLKALRRAHLSPSTGWRLPGTIRPVVLLGTHSQRLIFSFTVGARPVIGLCSSAGRKPHPIFPKGAWHFLYIKYKCSNCRQTEKVFSLAANRHDETRKECYKFGELPEYGPPTPSRLIKLVGPDRELFLKGRRCENQGLGIGAFVYYRRVVENQKNRILDEIIKVARKLNAPTQAIEELEAAQRELQFSKALSSVRTSIPQSLLINGHNPLTLLHSALSDGLHDRTDEHCLELASSVRVVLGELSDRLAQALKDEAELNRALSRLMRPPQ